VRPKTDEEEEQRSAVGAALPVTSKGAIGRNARDEQIAREGLEQRASLVGVTIPKGVLIADLGGTKLEVERREKMGGSDFWDKTIKMMMMSNGEDKEFEAARWERVGDSVNRECGEINVKITHGGVPVDPFTIWADLGAEDGAIIGVESGEVTVEVNTAAE